MMAWEPHGRNGCRHCQGTRDPICCHTGADYSFCADINRSGDCGFYERRGLDPGCVLWAALFGLAVWLAAWRIA
jgi:hypothetical protein